MFLPYCFFLALLLGVLSAHGNEIEISSFYAKVYVAPSTNANFIGLTQKGERYLVLGIRDSWYHIRFKNANGWIQFNQVVVVDTEKVIVPEEVVKDTLESVDTIAPIRSISSDRARDSVAALDKLSNSPRSPSPPEYTSEPADEKPIKRKSGMRNWFSQQSPTQLPPTVVPTSDEQPVAGFFHVTTAPARVLSYLSPEAPILGMARQGEYLQLIGEGDSWCKVAFAGTIGWIEHKNGKVVASSSMQLRDYIVPASVALGIILILIIILIFTKRRKNIVTTSPIDVSLKKNVLIIAKKSKPILYTLTDIPTSVERCFSEVGFLVTSAYQSADIEQYLQTTKPDVILVDYQLDKAIIPTVEQLCLPHEYAQSLLFIAYNVPDPDNMPRNKILPGMTYLGLTFSDRDIFKLVTPLMQSSNAQDIKKSVQSSALEGEIGAGNLLEVLQFIEIGSKTGCLLIEMEKPFAIICFKNGRIVFAATAEKVTGREAVFEVLNQKQGTFKFVLDKKPKTTNVNLSTLEVLMEWTQAIDEARVP